MTSEPQKALMFCIYQGELNSALFLFLFNCYCQLHSKELDLKMRLAEKNHRIFKIIIIHNFCSLLGSVSSVVSLSEEIFLGQLGLNHTFTPLNSSPK